MQRSLVGAVLGAVVAFSVLPAGAQVDEHAASEPPFRRLSRDKESPKEMSVPQGGSSIIDYEAPPDSASEGSAPAAEPPAMPEAAPVKSPVPIQTAEASPSPMVPAAASPTTTVEPTVSSLRPLGKALENLRWEASLAENAYNLSKTEATTLPLIIAYEKVIGPLCMPELHKTLEYKGPPTDPRCIEYLEKLGAIEPENPMALCARDGIDAKSCRSASALQRVDIFYDADSSTTASSTSQGLQELESRVAATTTATRLSALEAKIQATESRLLSNMTVPPEQRAELQSNFEAALGLACRLTRLNFEMPDPSSVGFPTPSPYRDILQALPTQPPLFPAQDAAKSQKKESPMEAVLRELGGELPPTPVVGNGVPRVRKRMITQRCKELIDRALRVDRTMAIPVCYRDGFYTPSCIDARRRALRAPQLGTGSAATGTTGAPPPQPRGKDGFSTF